MSINKVTETSIDEVIDRWFDSANAGDWVGVFENHDLGHPDLGRRFAAFYDQDEWDRAELMRTTGPDSSIGLGWRYLLVAKLRTPQAAKAAMSVSNASPNAGANAGADSGGES